jgi:hypothetical protein
MQKEGVDDEFFLHRIKYFYGPILTDQEPLRNNLLKFIFRFQ